MAEESQAIVETEESAASQLAKSLSADESQRGPVDVGMWHMRKHQDEGTVI